MDTHTINFKVDKNIGFISLSRPNVHNALSQQMVIEISQVLQTIKQNSMIRLLIVKSEGDNFCAGADLNDMKKMVMFTKDENFQDALILGQMFYQLDTLPIPVIAIVQGAAYGGGVGLVSCCDVVLALPNAKFCLSEVKLGLIPAVISPYVIRAIGSRQARRFFLTAEMIDAEKAREIGLIHEIIPALEMESYVTHLTQKLLANGPKALQAAKQLIREVTFQEIDDMLINNTASRIADLRISPEGQEGLNAFLTKRKAFW